MSAVSLATHLFSYSESNCCTVQSIQTKINFADVYRDFFWKTY